MLYITKSQKLLPYMKGVRWFICVEVGGASRCWEQSSATSSFP